MILLQQMIALSLFMMVGYYMSKKGIMDRKGEKALSWIILNVATPAMTLQSGLESELSITQLLSTFLYAACAYVGLILIAPLVPRILHVEKHQYGAYKVMTIFSNIGFMGFPLVRAMYGAEALIHAAVFTFFFNFLVYTYGIMMMQQDGEKGGIKWKAMLNPGTICGILAVLSLCVDFEEPLLVETTLSNLANMCAAGSMIVIGASLTAFPLKNLFTDTKLLTFSAIKLLLIPLLGMLIYMRFIEDGTLLGVIMIMLSTPVASTSSMLAQQYNGDVELTAKGVALTTIFSVVTIPIVSLILGL